MDTMLNTLEDSRLIAALEANLEEEMLCFGRGLAGAEIYHDGEIEGFFTGRGHLNGILRTHLHTTEPDAIVARIKAVKQYFRAQEVASMGWSIGQDCQPANLALLLQQQDFHQLADENVGMALAIEAIQAEDTTVEGLEIREIEDLEELKILRQLEIAGFGSSEELAQNYYEMYAGVGFGRGTVWRHFCGWYQGQAVASTSLLFHAGVAGLYGVATIPEARRRGIARAMVTHAIEQARQEGYHIAILSPTEMSEGIYRRLGFREYTVIRHYTCRL